MSWQDEILKGYEGQESTLNKTDRMSKESEIKKFFDDWTANKYDSGHRFFGVNWDKKMLNESEIIELLSDFKNNSINPKA